MGKELNTNYAKTSSHLISVIFHPAFLPVYGLLIIFFAPTLMMYIPFQAKKVIFLLAFINMTVVPVALLPLLRYRNIITSYSLESREERIIPMGIGCMMYIITTIILYSYQIPGLVKTFTLAAAITSLVLLLITFKWKISIHSAGMGGLLATVISLSLRMSAGLVYLWVTILLISGLIMSARLYMNSHNPSQVYIGFVVGFTTFLIVMMIS